MEAVFHCVLVLYSADLSNSLTFKNISQIMNPRINVIIVDNGINKEFRGKNEYLCNSLKLQYLCMNGNSGLSKAYNCALECICKNEKREDIIVWLDEDTGITQEYFDALAKAIHEEKNCDIFVPIIRGQNGRIWSPNCARFLKNKQMKNPKEHIPDSLFNAVNSCSAVKIYVYENYRYDERLFVDQVDYKFYDDQRELERHFCKLEVEIIQNFSHMKKGLDSKTAWKRLQIRIVDIMRYAFIKKKVKYIILGYIKCCGLGVKLGLSTRSASIVMKTILLSTKLLFVDKEKYLFSF